MPLDANGLQQALRDLFNGVTAFPASAEAAGTTWAQIYTAYAKTAHAAETAPLAAAADAQAEVLADDLTDAFVAAQAAGPSYLTPLLPQLVEAFGKFWPPVGFAAPGVLGVATSPLPVGLTASLTGFFTAGNPPSGPRPSGTDQADSMAALLDAWTRTVTVINTPAGFPPRPPVFLT
jgi:hypothetical protein